MTDCIASVSILPTASKESVNIEDLVDDFVIFYVAGDGKYYMAYTVHTAYIYFFQDKRRPLFCCQQPWS